MVYQYKTNLNPTSKKNKHKSRSAWENNKNRFPASTVLKV